MFLAQEYKDLELMSLVAEYIGQHPQVEVFKIAISVIMLIHRAVLLQLMANTRHKHINLIY